MNKVLTRGIITIAAVNDGKDGHSLTAKAFIEGSYHNGFTKGVKSYVKVFYDGQEVKDFTVSYRYKGAGQADWVKPQTNKVDYWVDAQRDGSTLFVEYVVEYKGLTAVATGRLDNIQDGKDAVSYKLIPMQESATAYKAESGKRLVRLLLAYKIQKIVGEVTQELALGEEGITLSVNGDITASFVSIAGAYILDEKKAEYKEARLDTYIVTLKKNSDIVDKRIVPITFKPKVMFDFGQKVDGLDGEINGIAGKVSTLDGRVSGFETTIDHFRTEVKDKVSHSELKQTAEGIVAKVGSSVNANLLWGSDLNLDGVDTTSKAAIAKRLGVGLNATRVESKEWFEYLKGGGVAGADAIKAKVAAVNGEGNYYAGLYWQIGFGAKSNVKVKPNTKYTFSFWIRTEILQGRGYAVAESFNMESLTGGRKDRTMPWTDVKATNEWERKSYTFTTGATGYIMVGVGLSCKDNSSGLIYLCHPKLEEGEVATPWCAYDGTVDALLATGLDIRNRKFTATADNFVVRNNRGEQTFMVDEDGRINNGMLTSRLRLTEPTIITKENYKEFCYNGKLNGHNVLFLDLLKCGTLLVLTDVPEELFLDLPSFKYFKSYNNYTQKEVAKEQYDKMRYIGNTIILYNIDSHNVYVSGVLKYKKMEGMHDYGNLDEFGFYALDRMSCTSSVLTCFECKFGITKPEKSQPWFYRTGGVYWEFCCVTLV